MSCNYADGLSPYENKGVLGLAELFDSSDEVLVKCEELAKLIKEAKHVVIHTGAGISTSAGIPDFRGPKGVWTLEEKGLKPDINVSFGEAKPTKTHMAIKKFIDEGLFHYVVSQNIDGLHLKSGVAREHIAELHGNMFVDQCNICKRLFVRSSPTPTVGQKLSAEQCKGKGRPCRGKLQDTILDWEHSLPDNDLEISDLQSSIADLSICLGTTLQIVPSGNIPLNTLRYGGKLVICNLQPTKHDNKADLIINTYVDDVMENIAKMLGVTIPTYTSQEDPTSAASTDVIEWTIKKSQVAKTKSLYKSKCNGVTKRRLLAKRPNNFRNSGKVVKVKIKANNVPPKTKKTPKPKKRAAEVEDSVIVIDDEDSNGSDVIFIDDNDAKKKFDNKTVTNEYKSKLINSDITETKETNSEGKDDILQMMNVSKDSSMNENGDTNQDNGTVSENDVKNPILCNYKAEDGPILKHDITDEHEVLQSSDKDNSETKTIKLNIEMDTDKTDSQTEPSDTEMPYASVNGSKDIKTDNNIVGGAIIQNSEGQIVPETNIDGKNNDGLGNTSVFNESEVSCVDGNVIKSHTDEESRQDKSETMISVDKVRIDVDEISDDKMEVLQ